LVKHYAPFSKGGNTHSAIALGKARAGLYLRASCDTSRTAPRAAEVVIAA